VVFSLRSARWATSEETIFKSSRPTYAIILLALSVLFMCATFLPLLYSVLLPNEDIERVVGALREGGRAPSDAETVVEQAKTAAGSLTTAMQVGYYSGVTATFHLSGSHSPEQTKVSQTTYIAWFQKRPRPMLVAITLYANDEGQKAYGISEVDPARVVRAYAVPIFLLGVSVFLVRKRKSSTTAS